MVELTISNVLLAVLTLLLGGVGYLVLLAPGKKQKEEALKEMAFDDLMDDQGWAEEGEREVKKRAPALEKPTPPPVPTPSATPSPIDAPVQAQTHDPSLPFQIGDRVVLQKLVGAAALNGRHGVIAAPYDKKAQRYPVDLDLYHDKPLAVKEANLLKEVVQPPAADDDDMPPKIANGCLEAAHAKACGFIFHVLRKSCSQTLNGETNIGKLSMFGWQFWKSNDGKGSGVYSSLLQYLTADILKSQKLADLDKQVSPNPEDPAVTKGAYRLVTKAMKSPQAVAGWNVRVEGKFWIVGMGPAGTMVVPCHNTRQVYIVAGYQAPLMQVAGGGPNNQFPRPPKFHLTLVPWFGVLVHDPFVVPSTGTSQVELASPQLAQELILNSKRAVAEHRIVTCLQQLHCEDGPNLQGVPLVRPPIPQNKPQNQDPPTEAEKQAVTQLAQIKNLIPPPDGLWNFVRPPNTAHYVMINAKGEKFAEFTPTSDTLNDMPVQVLQHIVQMCQQRPKLERPAAIGVDHPKTCQRLQFLCYGVPNLRILMLNVKQQQAAGGDGGGGAAAKPAAEAAAVTPAASE